MRTLVMLPALLLGAAVTAAGQELTYDETTGNYRLHYFSDRLNREVAIEVVPPNKVAPQLDLMEVTALGSLEYEYRYRLSNRTTPEAVQPLHSVELRCPDPEETETFAPQGWNAYQGGTSRWRNGPTPCVFSARDPQAIPPGGSAEGFRVRTRWLPGIAEGFFRGRKPPFSFPTGEAEAIDPKVYELVSAVTGVRGGWKAAPTVAPVRDPRQLKGASDLLEVLRSDLERVCGHLGWVSDAELCGRLNDGVADLENAVGADRAERARSALAAFLDTLDQGRNGMRGNAYWLLRINAEFLRSKQRQE